MSLKLTRGAVLGGALTLGYAQVARGATGENTPLNLGSSTAAHAASGAGSSSSSGILRTVIGLVIVVALIYAVAWVLKRVKRSGGRGASGNGLTQLATLPLGSGRSIALIRAGKEVVLVGVAEHGVTPIRTYTEAEAIAGGLDVPEEQAHDNEPADDYNPGLLAQLRRLTVRS
jgi:flagellar protein FliO/FliZ